MKTSASPPTCVAIPVLTQVLLRTADTACEANVPLGSRSAPCPSCRRSPSRAPANIGMGFNAREASDTPPMIPAISGLAVCGQRRRFRRRRRSRLRLNVSQPHPTQTASAVPGETHTQTCLSRRLRRRVPEGVRKVRNHSCASASAHATDGGPPVGGLLDTYW